MTTKEFLTAMAFGLLAVSSANGQIVGGVMTVTGAEMHWWAGVACDATARLYDVDEDSVVFQKLQKSRKYDQGTVTFRARQGRLIDLDKLHESIWATRLSGGTRSGLVSLEVIAVGKVVATAGGSVLEVSGSDSKFVLQKNTDGDHAAAFSQLQAAVGSNQTVRVTGRIGNYMGRWPDVLRNRPAKPRQILVTKIELLK